MSLGEEDYEDYTEQDVEEFPELDYSDKQLAEAVSKLDKKEYKQHISLRDQYLQQYREVGRINTFSNWVRESLQERFPGIPGADAKAVLELKEKLELKKKDAQRQRRTEIEVPIKCVKKEQGVEKLTPFLAQTIKECIDLSVEPDESLLIKMWPNVPLHQALTDDKMDLHNILDKMMTLMQYQNTLFLVKRKIPLPQLQLKIYC